MSDIQKLIDIMAALRNPVSGCPWDREQDFASIAPYTIEEAYEVADAIDRRDLQGLKEELGDLLLQVVFHARMAEEQGAFGFNDVVMAITDKLQRRHPHVFANERIASAAEQRRSWEILKAGERGREGYGAAGVLDGVAAALPALSRAEKLGRRAGGVGFDWPDAGAVTVKLHEELAELEHAADGDQDAVMEEIGDLLFTVANLARHRDVDPEEALRQANRKFERRFRHVEQAVLHSGRRWADFSAGELDLLWNTAKRCV